MGLQGHLNDISSDSIPLLVVALIANCIGSVRDLVFHLLQSTGLLSYPDQTTATFGNVSVLGSGIAGIIILAEQLNLNKVLSHRFCGGGGGEVASDCVVCLCTLRDGELVRKLDCRHVFHKDCFDGWLYRLNFNCPICRSPLKTDQRVDVTRSRVGDDLFAWFALRRLGGWH